MKRKLGALLLGLILIFGCAACDFQEQVANVTEFFDEIEESIPATDSPAEKETTPLTVATGVSFDREWDAQRKMIVASVSYPAVKLADTCREAYLQLDTALAQFSADRKKAQMDMYADLLESAKDFVSLDMELETNEQAYVRRADERAVSLLIAGDSYSGGAHGYYYYDGVNFDTKTGKRLSLSDVVEDVTVLPKLIDKELSRFWDEYDLYSELDMEEYFNPEQVSWTLDYQGITFYFNPYEIASYASGAQVVMLSADEYPDLIKKEYQNASPAFGVAMTPNVPFYFDVDKDGEMESVLLTEMYDRYEMMETFSIHIDDTVYTEPDVYVYSAEPTFISTENGDALLYVELQSDNDYRYNYCYSLGGAAKKLGTIDTQKHYEYTDNICFAHAINNPAVFWLDSRTAVLSTVLGKAKYAVDASGLPQTEQMLLYFDDALVFTLLQSLEVELYSEAEDKTVGTRVLPIGEKVTYYAVRGKKEAFFLLADGKIGKVTLDSDESWPKSIGGVDINDIFEGLRFAG